MREQDGICDACKIRIPRAAISRLLKWFSLVWQKLLCLLLVFVQDAVQCVLLKEMDCSLENGLWQQALSAYPLSFDGVNLISF